MDWITENLNFDAFIMDMFLLFINRIVVLMRDRFFCTLE